MVYRRGERETRRTPYSVTHRWYRGERAQFETRSPPTDSTSWSFDRLAPRRAAWKFRDVTLPARGSPHSFDVHAPTEWNTSIHRSSGSDGVTLDAGKGRGRKREKRTERERERERTVRTKKREGKGNRSVVPGTVTWVHELYRWRRPKENRWKRNECLEIILGIE